MNSGVAFVPHIMKVSRIVVTSYEDKVLCGTMETPCFAEIRPFKGIISLLLMMETLQNELNFPEEATQPRIFRKVREIPPRMLMPSRGATPEEPVIATFRITVLFKQNATWQGSIFWEEDESEANFRSVFEMIKLIDSVFLRD